MVGCCCAASSFSLGRASGEAQVVGEKVHQSGQRVAVVVGCRGSTGGRTGSRRSGQRRWIVFKLGKWVRSDYDIALREDEIIVAFPSTVLVVVTVWVEIVVVIVVVVTNKKRRRRRWERCHKGIRFRRGNYHRRV